VINADVAAQLDAYTTGPVHRLWGADRYATAAAIVRAFWSNGPAFIATGQNFPDALAGGAVAGRNGEPVLLVKGSPFPAATGQEILRLGSVRLFMLGGPAAISSGVEALLKKLVATP
jgi:putative cell wall-binding protein